MSSQAVRRVRFALGFVIGIAAAGCTTPHILTGPDLGRLPAVVHVGDTVRATTANATQELEIVAFEDGGALRVVTPEGGEARVLVADITALEYRSRAPGRTTMVVLGAMLGATFLDLYHSCEPYDEYGAPACSD